MKKVTKKIKFSVIVPSYNAAENLNSCLEALSNQSVPREQYEIILVDDGSVDHTKSVAEGFGVSYIHQTNKGPATARNKGAQKAKGDFILFTDSDCIPESSWIKEMISPFKDPEIIGVKGVYKTRQKELVARFAQAEFEDRYDLLQKFVYIDMIDTYSAAFRRDIFLKINGFDQCFPVANNEDTDLSYRLASAGYKLVFNPKAAVYHTHPNTLGKYLKTKFWRGYWRIVVYKRYPKKAVEDTYTPITLKIQTLLMAVSLAISPICLIFIKALYLPILFCFVIVFLAFPFSYKTYKKDKLVGLLSPAIIMLRSFVFAIGGIMGVLRCLLNDFKAKTR